MSVTVQFGNKGDGDGAPDLNPLLLARPKMESEADLSRYVAQHRKHFDQIEAHKMRTRQENIDYHVLWEKMGRSHVKARGAIDKLCREEEDHKITRQEEKRRARETAIILETMARRTATMGPPTLNSAVRRNLAADPTERRRYREARKKHGSAWEESLRRSYASRELNLQFLGFDLLPPRIFNTLSVGRLNVLRVSGNQLECLPAAIGTLVGLTELNCSNNEIGWLPPQMCYLNRLKILRASQNKLVFLPVELQTIRTLQEIDVCGNALCELPYNFGNHVALRKLQLGANRLSWLPGSFKNLISLKQLTLSQNPVAALCLMPSNSDDWETRGAGASASSGRNQGKKAASTRYGKLSEAQDRLEAWTRVIDRWGEITYINKVTEIARRTLPDVVAMAGRAAVEKLVTINVSRGAYYIDERTIDPEDELFNSGVG
jgi:hypothetical protein